LSHARWEIIVTGTVQGVGFRPFIYRLAERFHLSGWVLNGPQGVRIQIQGDPDSLHRFLESIRREAPAHAIITKLTHHSIPLERDHGLFKIIESDGSGEAAAAVPADLAACPECLAEVANPDDRRYRYAFANCTHCGPRFTILNALPYDRPSTSMTEFPLCPACAREYHDPSDRRFHAEPIACPVCGPSLQLLSYDAKTGRLAPIPCADPLHEVAKALCEQKIVAIKGLGGFHLACDAAAREPVKRIRTIKGRDEKPFAVMMRDLEAIRTICQLIEEDEQVLTSAIHPIVILRRKEKETEQIAAEVAPGQDTLGVMLPYTPLHQLLMEACARPLVMTSANLSDQPIAKDESELDPSILQNVDLVLTHNRRIVARCDDSVVITSPHLILIRRSRGYVPTPIQVPLTAEALGVGADLKNTACFIRKGLAYPTQHIGDIEDTTALAALRSTIDHFVSVFGFKPKAVGCDPHPNYYSRRVAEAMGLPVVAVQHHYAHIAACLAENEYSHPAIGVAFDGTGYGLDGTIWGGEFLIADFTGFERKASLRPIPMPGGEGAVREPWRMAVAYLLDAFDGELPNYPGIEQLKDQPIDLLLPALRQRINTPLTSSSGRLFDAVAGMMGLILQSRFQGQAAMALEQLAGEAKRPFPLPSAVIDHDHDLQRLDFRPVIREIIAGIRRDASKPELALGFHLAVANGILNICKQLRATTGLQTVALSGGVFQNRLLLAQVIQLLETAGLTVLHHRHVPPNDGGIALGQAAVASVAAMKE
jgi:hydrogenase maturation protein HypF